MNSEKQGENLGPNERTGDSGASPQDLLARYDAAETPLKKMALMESLSEEDEAKLIHALGARMFREGTKIQYPSKTRGVEDNAAEQGEGSEP